MKRAMEIQVGDRVFDRGRSFKVKEILIDAQGLIRFRDMQGHIHGPYVPNEFIGVKRPGEKGDCNGERSPEIRRDEDERELHKDGHCEGAPYRWLCQYERDRLQELEAKGCACGHQKERHYWTRRKGEPVHLCRDCTQCLGFERPDPENGFTVEEINKRWECDRQSEINRRAAVHLEPLREALRLTTVNFMFDAVFGPRRHTGE